MYGVLQATCGSNPLWVDDENDFPNALNPTGISEWKKDEYKLNKHELIFITIKLLNSLFQSGQCMEFYAQLVVQIPYG